MLFAGAVLQESHPGDSDRLLSQVPGLEPPVGFCSTGPSDTAGQALILASWR